MAINPEQYPFVREPMNMGDITPLPVVDIAEPNLPVVYDGARISDMGDEGIEVDFGYDGTEYGLQGPRDPREATH